MDDIKEVLKSLKIEEKIALLIGKNYWETNNFDDIDIKTIVMSDGPHGLRKQNGSTDNIGFNASEKATCLPTACTLACSFDRNLLRKVGELLAKECKNQNVDILLGPGVNIKRHPLCGRNFEYFSEDSELSGELGASFVAGLEQNGVGSCVKHYACNNQEFRRQISNSVVDDFTLHNVYLKPFKTIIRKSNPSAIMSSYNLINGVYGSENNYLLNTVLRIQENYHGIVISDWGAINEEVKSFQNGLNLEMPGIDKSRAKTIKKAFDNGLITEDEIDKAITPLLNFIKNHQKEFVDVDYNNHYEEAVNICNECGVLIRNRNDILPLKTDESVMIVGGFVSDIRYQGGGSSNVYPYKLEQINDIYKEYSENISCYEGYALDFNSYIETNVEAICEKAKKCDKVVYLCGLPLSYESEGYDRNNLEIPSNQITVFNRLYNVNRNIVVVLLGGAPFELPFVDLPDGILIKYLGGEGVSRSILDTLYGKVNPSGRLAETWPMSLEDTPCDEYPSRNYNALYKEGPYIGYRHYHTHKITPMFAFGEGLSYSKHIYTNFEYQKDKQRLSFDLINNSDIDGKEVIQIYVECSDESCSYITLKYFDKVELKANETKHIEIYISDEFFKFYNSYAKAEVVHSGVFTISVRKNALTPIYSFVYNSYSDYKFNIPPLERNLHMSIYKNNVKGSYTINSTMNDLNTCLIGRLFNKIIKFIAKIYVKKNPSLEKVIEESLFYSPMRIFVIGTNGFIGYRGLRRLLFILNGFKKAK